ncbi:unnamed protein product [Agarophyton chilense]|eukprot:gb/GEZJ01003699.1/.p2 GENE.gb/GEZJ01003699.1/~~gb/GEZJ01003699.1/.p2  ORF type:complete len:568 (+),score=89.15 gb/GEZJ01003699.1/:233-1705(+)
MRNLRQRGFDDALRDYLADDRPFLGICLGLHTLFDASDESPAHRGLGVLPGRVRRFCAQRMGALTVPHIGWNTVAVDPHRPLHLLPPHHPFNRFYFVHSFCVDEPTAAALPHDVHVALTTHGERFVSVLQRGQLCATQFHPEKSGPAGLDLLRRFVHPDSPSRARAPVPTASASASASGLAKRVVACLDVRENDAGDLVVTKGDQYDVRDRSDNNVRNLGKPVQLARRYFEDGADEICFLNITSFRGEPVSEAPMLEVLQRTSREVFVPLCVGGGIRDYTDAQGHSHSALDVAATYFRAGADKISVGSDAVYAAERFWKAGGVADGTSSIERISHVYGAQAVVVSVDARRVFVQHDHDSDTTPFRIVRLPDGRRCWYQCTVKGGREGRDIDVVQLVTAVERLGAGEILLNCVDADGQGHGFDLTLIALVKAAVHIPVIASSGAGCPEHFTKCFDVTGAEAALAAGIFHRGEVRIADVKAHMSAHGTPVRL